MLHFDVEGCLSRLYRLQHISNLSKSIFFLLTIVVSALLIWLLSVVGLVWDIWPLLLPIAWITWAWRAKAALLFVSCVMATTSTMLFFSGFRQSQWSSDPHVLFHLSINIGFLFAAIFFVNVVKYLVIQQVKLSKQYEAFKLAVELSSDAIELLSPEGLIAFVNPAWEQTFGYKKEDVIGFPVDSLLRSSKRKSDTGLSFEDALKQGKVWKGKVQSRNKEEQVLSVSMCATGLYQGRELVQIVSIKHDLREQKEVALKLRAFHALPDTVFSVDFEGYLLSFKAPYELTKRTSISVELGVSVLVAIPPEIMPEDVAHRIYQMVRRSLQVGELQSFEYELHLEGTSYYEARLIPDQKEGEVLVVIRDISKRKQLERALELAQLSFRNIIERNQDGTIIVDASGIVRFTSPAAQRFLRGQGVRLGSLFDYPLLVGTSTEIDIVRSVQKDGSEVMGVGEMQVMETEWVGDSAYLASIRDITERKRVEKKLAYQAFHDLLTGMPNRAFLLNRLGSLMEQSLHSPKQLFGVLFMDLDRFKNVNDSLGHHAGDQLLIEIASRLQRCMEGLGVVARLGGDEFVVLLESIHHKDELRKVAETILYALKAPFLIKGHEIFTSASIGIAVSSIGYHQPEDILRDADTAMYQAKKMGKSRYVLFDKQMHHHALQLLHLENDLKRAVEQNEFVLFFQPILSLKTHLLEGFEVLVRWLHPKEGLLSPGAFIEVAEDTGLIVPMGWWVMREACRQMRVWQLQFPEHPLRSMSVNLAAGQFAQHDFVSRVLGILRETGLPPKALKLEITEGALIEQVDVATEMLADLRKHQIQVHMDDFGTGYSSLSYLQQFPVDALKIDRSFVSKINEKGEHSEIIRAIVLMAHSLNLTITAEGAEHMFQVETLRRLGCERVQGFVVSRPVDVQTATMMVQHPNWFQKKHPVRYVQTTSKKGF